MLSVLHSFYKPICLTLIVLLGLACGHLVDAVLQIKLRPTYTVETEARPMAVQPSSKTVEGDLNLILRNNIFDENNRSMTATMSLTPGTGPSSPVEDGEQRTDLKLFGTVVAGERSLVLLEANRDLQVYHLDDEIPGGGILEQIERTQIRIRNRDQSLTTLVLHEQGPSSNTDKPAQENGRQVSGTIREVGENRWIVSQNMVDSVRENFSTQLRLAQMQPRLVNGKTDGFMVQRLYPRSILSRMGLKRGDVVLDVNSIKLDSPEKALQVFQQLREARQITVAVERNNQPMSFVYEIE